MSDEPETKPGSASQHRFFMLIPAGTKFDFIGRRRPFIMLSVFLVVASLAMLVINTFTVGTPLNFGIDFQGGSQIRLALREDAPEIVEIREALEELGYAGSSAVAVPDKDNEVLIRVKEVISISPELEETCEAALDEHLEGAKLLPRGWDHPEGSSKVFLKFDAQPKHSDVDRILSEAGCEGAASAGTGNPEQFPVEYALVGIGPKIAEQLGDRFGSGVVDHIVASETVGAKVGNQLKLDGIRALMIALGLIFLYVMLRFDLRFAPGGIVALLHDATIVVGAFALTGKEFNLQTIAALLTIVGYSINDTIVVFDRIRERVSLNREDPIEQVTNVALNETLSRTILTSGTTLLVVIATWVIGTGAIKDFAFALFIGIVVGTFSSLFVASPVFLWVNHRFYQGRGHLIGIPLDGEKQEGTGTLLGIGQGQRSGLDGAPQEEGEGDGDLPAPDEEGGPEPEKKTRRRRRKRPESGE